ncbi:cadherin-like beta sandwich domain-containing protein [Paenibacillus sp. J2TS4]|uniref:cadherin-like beta sandwich domain-containing protein n=1 Tax=Paenibacillus sp. J2TS4 TaxID=2807194 RepID=UPI001B1AB8F3|nr:cadherin-like beta sandwich domain-containing protein [Paenibacillus sp. J2TS4]GIP34179.1 hypothetical protein J2TS4_33890 [Paenibacillus sp. J2TS4]
MRKKRMSWVGKIILCSSLLLSPWLAAASSPTAYADNNNYSLSLANLALDNYSLSPAFSPLNVTYTANVPYHKTSIRVTATAQDRNVTLNINGTSVGNGSSRDVPLYVGSNIITISVVAPNGSSKLYTINVKRKNIGLVNLFMDAASLNEPFDPEVTSYSANIPEYLSFINVTAATDLKDLTIKINGRVVSSGVPAAIPITGVNSLMVEVSSSNNEMTVYTISLNRSTADKNGLSYIYLEGASLNRGFDPSVTSYSSVVNNYVSEVKVSPTYGSNIRSVTIRGSKVASGSFYTVPLSVGDNEIAIEVDSYDNTKKTYRISVTRLSYNDNPNPGGGGGDSGGNQQFAYLSNISLTRGNLNRAFDSNVLKYYATVNNSTSSLQMSVSYYSGITAKINGKSVQSGSYQEIPLKTGDNNVAIEVQSSSGDIRYYTVTITRLPSDYGDGGSGGNIGDPSTVLNNLLVEGLSLDKAFQSNISGYSSTVSYPVSHFRLSPIYNSYNMSVKVNGQSVASGEYYWAALNVGTNTVTIEVRSDSGGLSYYTIAVTRLAEGQTHPGGVVGDNSLISIGSPNIALDRSFHPNDTYYRGYTGNTSFTFTPVTSGNSRIRINNTYYSSGQLVSLPLNLGENSVVIEVVPNNNGASRTYTFIVSRGDYSSDPSELANIIIPGVTYSPLFDKNVSYYHAKVESGMTSIKMMPVGSIYSITINGYNVNSLELSPELPLSYGDNKFEVKVQNHYGGSSGTYTFWITRSRPEQEGHALNPYLQDGDLIVSIASPSDANITYAKLKTHLETSSQTFNRIIFKIASGNYSSQPNYVMLDQSMLEYLRRNSRMIIAQTPDGTITVNPWDVKANGFKAAFEIKDADSITDVPANYEPLTDLYSITLEGLDGTDGRVSDSSSIKGTIELPTRLTEAELRPSNAYRYTDYQRWEIAPGKTRGTTKEFTTIGNSEIIIMKPAPVRFPDISGHWGRTHIEFLASKNIVSGYEDGTFKPDRAITRAEFVTILVNALNLEGSTSNTSFSDVTVGDWYYEAVVLGAHHRLIEGYEDGQFKPNLLVSREEMAVVLERLMKQKLGMNADVTSREMEALLGKYDDADEISSWAKQAIAANIKMEAMSGLSDRRLAPQESGTRAQIATLLYKIMDKAQQL